MFGERRAEKSKSIIERVPEKFSVIHHAGVILFAGLLHAGAYHEYHSASKQIAEMKMVLNDAKSDVETLRWLVKHTELKMGQSYRTFSDSEIFSGVQQNILQELNSGKERTVAISDVLGYEEYFVEGIPMETIEKGTINFLEVANTLLKMRVKEEDPSLVSDEVLNAMLAERGEYDENQPSAFVLFAEGRGNCIARAKAEAMLVDYVFKEHRGTNWMQTELYRGYTDATGKEHPGHIRLVLDFEGSDTLTVMGGSHVYEAPRRDDHVTRIEAHDAFVRGSAAAMGIVEGGGADYDYNPQRLGIRFPDSPIRYLGSEDGETQWWANKPDSPEEGAKYFGLAHSIDVLDEAVTNEQVEALIVQKKEKADLIHRFESFLDAHKAEGVVTTESRAVVTGGTYIGTTKVVILPLNASQKTRTETEDLVLELRKAMPDATIKILYGITSADQKILPISDPDAEYIFLKSPTEEQIKDRLELLREKAIYVKTLQVAIEENNVHPFDNKLVICDPIKSLSDLRTLNVLIDKSTRKNILYALDLPEDVMEIPLSNAAIVLQRSDALQGKTIIPDGIGISIGNIHGSLPSIRAENDALVSLYANPSKEGQDMLLLGPGTEIHTSKYFEFIFYGPTTVQEGWTANSVPGEITNQDIFLTFRLKADFDSRAFAGIQRHIDVRIGDGLAHNFDPQAFDDIKQKVSVVATADDGLSFPTNAQDTDINIVEQRIRKNVQLSSDVIMTKKSDDQNFKYISFIPANKADQK